MRDRKKILLVYPLLLAAAGLCCARREEQAPPAGPPTARESAPPSSSTGATPARKVVMIVAPRDFRDEEYFTTKKILEEAGLRVVTASRLKGKKVTGMLGGTVVPDITLAEVNLEEYAGVVFVGGSGAAVYFADEKALGLAREAAKRGLVTGAICIAPSILANAGVLKGRRATVFPSEKKNLAAKGARCLDRHVVTDEKIVTADGPGAAEEFARALVRLLAENPKSVPSTRE